MQSFKEYVQDQEFVEFVINEFEAAKPAKAAKSATKDQIMHVWNQLQPNTPITIQPMADGETGMDRSSYGEDGIRITGSWAFIASIIGRLKELLRYENEATRLRLVFRGVDPSHGGIDKKSFVFYVNLENRKNRQKGLSYGSAS